VLLQGEVHVLDFSDAFAMGRQCVFPIFDTQGEHDVRPLWLLALLFVDHATYFTFVNVSFLVKTFLTDYSTL
jgi:hypothetical protein